MILTAIECCRSHIVLPIVGFVILLMTSAVWGQTGWDQYYGDSYVAKTRDCRDISNFFILEGPGNENPGNWMGLANPNIPDNIKDYIARQFKYVLFDQESFAVRSGRGSPVVSMMPPMYHSEARALMNRNPDLIVFPYFSFTLGRNDFPWMRSIDTTWILHEKVNPSARIKAGDPGYFLMDIRSAGWRNYFVSYIRDTVSHYGYRGVFLDNMTHYPFIQAADTTQLPAGAFGGWQHHLIDFLNTLRAELDPSVKVVCNSLGIDGTAPNAIPLFGPDHGKNLMPYVNGGAQIEEFHGTAWKAPLDSILSIMKYLRDSSKVFLAATHYYRGGMPCFRSNSTSSRPDPADGSTMPHALRTQRFTGCRCRISLAISWSPQERMRRHSGILSNRELRCTNTYHTTSRGTNNLVRRWLQILKTGGHTMNGISTMPSCM